MHWPFGVSIRAKSLSNRGAAGDSVTRTASTVFWLWIGYQTVKGIITTTVVWLPLLYYLLS